MNNNLKEQDNPLSDTIKGVDENGGVYPSGLQLFYHEYPYYYYTWNNDKKEWKDVKLYLKHI